MTSLDLRNTYDKKVVVTFALCGLASGAATFLFFRAVETVWKPQSCPILPWVIDGTLFLLALAAAVLACRAAGWLAMKASPERCIVAAVLVLGSPFAGMAVGTLSGLSALFILGGIFPHASEPANRFLAGLGLAFGTNVGTLSAAALLLLALRLIGAGAGRIGLAALGFAGTALGVVTATVLIASLHRDDAGSNVLGILHLAGEPLYGAAAGYCLSHAHLAPGPDQQNHPRNSANASF